MEYLGRSKIFPTLCTVFASFVSEFALSLHKVCLCLPEAADQVASGEVMEKHLQRGEKSLSLIWGCTHWSLEGESLNT